VTDPRRAVGARGELLAAAVYVTTGHRILGRRVATPPAEVDLVCRRGSDLVVVEVKRRRSAPPGVPWIADDQVERLYAAETLRQVGEAQDRPRLASVVARRRCRYFNFHSCRYPAR